MISFSFNKKISDTKNKIIKQKEKVEYISRFSNDNAVVLPAKYPSNASCSYKRKRKCIMNKTDVKNFVTNDIENTSASESKDFLKSLLNTKMKLTENDNYDRTLKLFSNNSLCKQKQNRKRRKGSSKKKPEQIVINDLVVINNGKFSGYIGKVIYLSGDSDLVRVYVEELQKEVNVRSAAVEAISNDEINIGGNSKVISPMESIEIEMEDRVVDNWMFVGLCVRLIDGSYQNGRYDNETVVIDDVLGPDECSCITSNKNVLYDVRQSMLIRVQPIRKQHAKVLGGPHLSRVVLVLAIDDLVATVVDVNSEEKFAIDIRLLCRMSSYDHVGPA